MCLDIIFRGYLPFLLIWNDTGIVASLLVYDPHTFVKTQVTKIG